MHAVTHGDAIFVLRVVLFDVEFRHIGPNLRENASHEKYHTNTYPKFPRNHYQSLRNKRVYASYMRLRKPVKPSSPSLHSRYNRHFATIPVGRVAAPGTEEPCSKSPSKIRLPQATTCATTRASVKIHT